MKRPLASLDSTPGQFALAFFASLLLAANLPACTDSDLPYPEPPTPPDFDPNPAPPPVDGGSMLITSSQLAVVADADHDAIWVADLRDDTLRGGIELAPGSQPGRLVEDADGRVHAVLRAAGMVATLDVDNLRVVDQRPVCNAPRGIAFDSRRDDLHVACASGELVTLPAAGGQISASVRLAPDLRDVVMDGDVRMVTRFITAEVLVVDDAGTVLRRTGLKPWQSNTSPPVDPTNPEPAIFQPSVAWRAVSHSTGGIAILHQRAFDGDVDPSDGYGGGDQCAPGIVQAAVSVVRADGRVSTDVPFPSLLAVDMAFDSTGQRGAMPMAGAFDANAQDFAYFVLFFDKDDVLDEDDDDDQDDPDECNDIDFNAQNVDGQPVAVAYDERDRPVVQTQGPYGLVILDPFAGTSINIDFPVDTELNRARHLFHAFGEAFISCASCHPNGRQDNHVWTFTDMGPRRTPALTGGLLGTEPFHWSGDMEDMNVLMREVFEGRMFQAPATAQEVEDMAVWLDSLPSITPPPPADAEAVARGRALFNDAQVGCVTCHAGPLTTDNRTVDVGTGEPLQVPRLMGIWARDNIMHNGCAATLADRFGPCGGGDAHGETSQLNAAEIADLVAYLETL